MLINVGHLLCAMNGLLGPIYHLDPQGVILEQLTVPAIYQFGGGALIQEIRWFQNRRLYFAISGFGNGSTDYGTHWVLQYDELGQFSRVAVHPDDSDPAQNDPNDPGPAPWDEIRGFDVLPDGSFLLRSGAAPLNRYVFRYDSNGAFVQRYDLAPISGQLGRFIIGLDGATLYWFQEATPYLFLRFDITSGMRLTDFPPLPTDYQAAVPDFLPDGTLLVGIAEFLGLVGGGRFQTKYLRLDANGMQTAEHNVQLKPPPNQTYQVGVRHTDAGAAFWLPYSELGGALFTQTVSFELRKIVTTTGQLLSTTIIPFTSTGGAFTALAVRQQRVREPGLINAQVIA